MLFENGTSKHFVKTTFVHDHCRKYIVKSTSLFAISNPLIYNCYLLVDFNTSHQELLLFSIFSYELVKGVELIAD